MKQTNYYTTDFLDVPDDSPARLWRACRPTRAGEVGGGIWLDVPFQCQQPGRDCYPDRTIPRRMHRLWLRAYGADTLRLTFDAATTVDEASNEGGLPDHLAARDASPMLDPDHALIASPLHLQQTSVGWDILDETSALRARVNLVEPPVEVWSDLLPPPDETLDLRCYPTAGQEVALSAYDQFQPNRHDAMALVYVDDPDAPEQPYKTAMAFQATHDECFAGTGERFAKMDLAGQTLQLENQDAQGVNNRRAYKNIPFYLSSRGYGVFVHTSAFLRLSLAHQSTRSTQFMVDDGCLDVFLFGGPTPERVLYQYRSLTGFPASLPLWSYGIWMSRMTYFSAEEVEGICRRLREEGYPCDVIHLDTGWFTTDWLCEWTFNPERFPDPPSFLKRLKDQGFRVSLWQLPYVADGARQLQEALEHRYIAVNRKRLQGGSNFSANAYAGTIDFTSPEATAWYQGLLKVLLGMGVTCIKTDFGEDIHLDADYANLPARLLHNLYPLLYQRAAWEITQKTTGQGIAWSRAGWAGCQRYPLHWGGDAACSWEGLAGSLKGGLHLGLSGFGYWSHDIPGFHGVPDFMNAVIPDDLYLRWTQFGVFTSHMRYHGTSHREPYHRPAIRRELRYWFRLRYALIPYLIRQAEACSNNGFPLLRALLLHHPADKTVWHIDDEYFLGDDFLVAPVVNAENRRAVYLPAGEWVHLFTGDQTTGPCWLSDVCCERKTFPVWVRAGAALPVYPEPVACTDEMDLGKTVILRIDEHFKGLDASFLGPLLNAEHPTDATKPGETTANTNDR